MKTTTKLAALATVIAAFALPSAALAQAAKIGSANVQKIFSDIKETKDLENKLKSRGQELGQRQNDAQQRVTALKASRDQFKPGTDTYDRANQELSRTATQLQVEIQIAQQELVREQKLQTKMIYDKVVAAVNELGKERGYAMVVAQIIPPEPSDDQFDRMTAEQLIQLLRQQNLLYVDPSADLTADVITRMDSKYVSPAGSTGSTGSTGNAPAGGTTGGTTGGTAGGSTGGAGAPAGGQTPSR